MRRDARFFAARREEGIGRTQFVELVGAEVPGGYNKKNGRININLYLASNLVKILLNEVLSISEVEVSA